MPKKIKSKKFRTDIYRKGKHTIKWETDKQYWSRIKRQMKKHAKKVIKARSKQ